MTLLALESEPACPASDGDPDPAASRSGLTLERRPFSSIDPATWDRLAARTPWSTPFSAWAFHRAWWDAYGDNAHDETTVVFDAGAPAGSDPVAILPLMHRHEVEATDVARHTSLRHGHESALTPVPASAVAIFFGASYHADYATILADPADLPAVADTRLARRHETRFERP